VSWRRGRRKEGEEGERRRREEDEREGGREGGREGRHYHFVIEEMLNPGLEDSGVVVRGGHLRREGGRKGKMSRQ